MYQFIITYMFIYILYILLSVYFLNIVKHIYIYIYINLRAIMDTKVNL